MTRNAQTLQVVYVQPFTRAVAYRQDMVSYLRRRYSALPITFLADRVLFEFKVAELPPFGAIVKSLRFLVAEIFIVQSVGFRFCRLSMLLAVRLTG